MTRRSGTVIPCSLSPTCAPRVTEDGTAVTRWGEDGTYSRLDGPAVEFSLPDGTVVRRLFYVRGDLHRLDGPAATFFDATGEPTIEKWFFHGDEVSGPPGIASALADYGYHRRHALLVESAYGALLDEGVTHRKIVKCLVAGVASVPGIREVLSGAPVEWVAAWERPSTR